MPAQSPLPPPHLPGKRTPRHWGVVARISWWFGNAADGESRPEAEVRAEAAAKTATKTAQPRGLLTGRVNRPIIWGHQKAAAAQQFCERNGVELGRSYFYADGDEDRALLECVGNPRVVNARSKLVAHASARGWPHLRVPAPPKRGRRRAVGG